MEIFPRDSEPPCVIDADFLEKMQVATGRHYEWREIETILLAAERAMGERAGLPSVHLLAGAGYVTARAVSDIHPKVGIERAYRDAEAFLDVTDR